MLDKQILLMQGGKEKVEEEQAPQEEVDKYPELLEYIKKLLKRQNLCMNTYLYKKMETPLTVPLYIIAEERGVHSISRDYNQITDAIENSGLAIVVKGKQVKLIDHPTVKISFSSMEGLDVIKEILDIKQKKYAVSKRTDSTGWVNLTVFGENIVWLEKLINSIDSEVIYERLTLMDDIRAGVDRIRKLKFSHAKTKTSTGHIDYQKYLNGETLPSFTRHALESDEQDVEKELLPKEEARRQGHNGYRGKRYQMRDNRGNRKPRLTEEDFPAI